MRHDEDKHGLTFVDFQVAHAAIEFCFNREEFGIAQDLAHDTMQKLGNLIHAPKVVPLSVRNSDRSGCDGDDQPSFEEAIQNGDAF